MRLHFKGLYKMNPSSSLPKLFTAVFLFCLILPSSSKGDDVPLEIRYADGTVIHDSIRLKDTGLRGTVTRGQMIIVDTRDQASCLEVKQTLRSDPSIRTKQDLEALCYQDLEKPYSSITVFREIDREEFRRSIDLHFLKDTDRTVVNETRNMAITMTAAMTLLWLMPESVSKWDKDEIRQKGFFNKYKYNVSHRPVVDKDDWAINYIGHPISGAAYYTMARHAGLTKMQSFGYSVLMSTFFWEYGFEAVAERPSIQDLILTPVVGSLLGELFYQAEMSIKENGGTLFGSEKAGKVAMVLLNPMGSISSGINRLLGSQVIQNSEAHIVMRRQRSTFGDPFSSGASSTYIGVEMRFTF